MAVTIEFTDAADGYRDLLRTLVDRGDHVAPRGQPTRELRNVTLVHHDPTDCLLTGIGRKLSPTLAAIEALQLVGGFSDPKLTIDVAPRYENFMDDGAFWGAYGERTGWQMSDVVDRLRDDAATRQAVVQFWDATRDLRSGKHDYPCTLSMEFVVRKNRLHASTRMRSNDAWLGWPYDLFQFTALQRAVARFVGVGVGTYTHNVGSMHVYERDLPAVEAVLDRDPADDAPRPRLAGGIGVAPSIVYGGDTWQMTQDRAQGLCYAPGRHKSPDNAEQAWFAETMKAWWASR